jgi:CheY-like chemotaxis protein
MPKVMLVEDDNNLREIYEARLQAEGYTIVSAKDGEEALTVAKAEKPELIISDVMMPKISGFEMLDILRNTEGLKNVRVIMLTALGQSEDQERATKLGADKYLVKSQVTLEDIVKVSHDLLEDQPAQAAAVPAAATPAPVISAPATAPTPPPVAPEPVATPPADTPVAPPPVETIATPPPAAPSPAPVISAPATAPTPPPVAPEPVATPPADTPVAPPPVETAASTNTETTPEASNDSGRKMLTEPPSSEPIDSSELGGSIAGGNSDEFDQSSGAPRPRNSETPGVEAISGNVGTINTLDKALASEVAAAEKDNVEAQTTSQEQKAVDDKIEDFIAGASSDAPGPDGTVAEPPKPPEETPTAAENKIEDDKLMASAVDDLTAAAQQAPAPVAPKPEPTVTESDGKVKPVSSKPKPGASVVIAGKKVIAPPANSDKPDLQTLLAMEAAKEAAEQPSGPPTAVVSTESGIESKPLDTPSTGSPTVDPNSISL